jgi:anti-sigma regulatory factor (Ser/Thr protein kinase)
MPVLDLAFDAGVLPVLREEVQAQAGRSGVPDDRAVDIVLAVHELAANTIVHGGGAGRLRMWRLPGALQCQVDDGDLMRALEERASQNGTRAAHPGDARDPASANSLHYQPGHGLWVARRLADRMQSLSGIGGTSVIVTFDLPR